MTLWQRLVTKQKALLKSATIWLAAFVAGLPDMLQFAQANFPSIAQAIPAALHDPVMHWIGVAIFVCRLRSMVKAPATTSVAVAILALLVAAQPRIARADEVIIAPHGFEVSIEKDAPAMEGHPLTSIVVTQCNLIVAVYMTMADGRLLRFDKTAAIPSDQLMTMAYSAARSERVEVSCNETGAVGYEKREPV